MKYKKYPSYKDSGVEWLGDIPENWNLLKNRHIFKTKDKVLNDKEDMTVLSLTTNGVKVKNNLSFGKSTESYVGHQMVYSGNLVFTPRDFDQTPILSGVSKYKGCISNLYLVLETNSKAYNHFVDYYWWGLKYKVNYFKNFSYGIRFSYNFEQFKEIPFLQPPIQEQRQIANFLDKATAKIDTLIEKQTKQIELLKEKRQAVISHAVTKGINPNVPMKDSGVEWLGVIPEHWEVKKLKFVLQLLNKKEKIINQIVVALENIESWSGKYIESDSSNQGDDVAFCIGDILFGKLRPYLAKVFLCSFDGIAFGDLLAYRPIKDYASKYAFYSLISEDFIKIVDSSTYGTKMPRASSEFLSEMRLTVPPLKEQQEIANYLDEKTSKIDILIEKSKKSIELLKEKRTSLISSAVTGKIDVREEV
ncbi:restriction endonuclease subunit S [Aliarcobacter cryaerophilus]|uniref:restriction endonuclease subunit S n=1 Tax=Aliarcobacter cryaerophilus TaxID=28198 RepID=UPI003DA5F216